MSIRIPPNTLGESNVHVYGELLGMSEAEIEALEAEGYIGHSYTPA